MAHEVFISYSSKNKSVADAVCARLEFHKIRCWIAPRDVLPGSNWGAAIIDAIGGSRIVVLVFSSEANTSDAVRRELERAVSSSKIIIPFRLEDIRISKEMEFFIAGSHWLDAFPPPLEDHIDRLAGAINAFLKGETWSSSEPRKEKKRGAIRELAWRVSFCLSGFLLLVMVLLGVGTEAGRTVLRSTIAKFGWIDQPDLALAVDIWNPPERISNYFRPRAAAVAGYRGEQRGGILQISPAFEYLNLYANGGPVNSLPFETGLKSHIPSSPVYLDLKLTNKSKTRGIDVNTARLNVSKSSLIHRSLLVFDQEALRRGILQIDNEGSAEAKDLTLRYSVVPQGTVVNEFEVEQRSLETIPPVLSVQLESPFLKSKSDPLESVQKMVIGEIAYSEQGVNSGPRCSVRFNLDVPGDSTPVQPGFEPTPTDSPQPGDTYSIELKAPGEGDPDPTTLARKLNAEDTDEIWLKITAPSWSVYEFDLYLDYNDGRDERTPPIRLKMTYFRPAKDR
jgi:hypothetical protein